jgi:hypothetical protein
VLGAVAEVEDPHRVCSLEVDESLLPVGPVVDRNDHLCRRRPPTIGLDGRKAAERLVLGHPREVREFRGMHLELAVSELWRPDRAEDKRLDLAPALADERHQRPVGAE